MRRFSIIVFTTAFVGLAAGTAMGQQTVACDGTESTGTGANSCDAIPRDYAYPVTDTAGNMTDVYIGTEDPNIANYWSVCLPPAWTMTIEGNAPPAPPFAGAPLMHSAGLVKTPHGGGSPGSVPGCPSVIHFSGPAGLPGGAWTFGFDHAWPSHDVEWQTINGGAPFFSLWPAPVGDGFGPVHAPAECSHECVKGDHWVDDTCAGQDSISLHGAVIGIDMDGDCIADTSLILSSCTPQLVDRSKPYPDDPGAPDHFNKIDTEILDMCLTGGGVTMIAGAGLGQGGILGASLGTITEQAGNPALADSEFDIYFEIDLGGGNYVYNQVGDPLKMSAVGPDGINCVPPDDNSYFHPFVCTPLYDAPVAGAWVANLVAAEHGIGPPPVLGACCPLNCPGCPCLQMTQRVCEGMKNAVYHGDDTTCDPNPCDTGDPAVPTVTGWGLVVVTLLAIVAGTIMLRHRRRLAA